MHFLEREPKPVKKNGNVPIYVSGLWSRACTITREAICYLTFSLYTEKTVQNSVCSVFSWPLDFTEGMLTSIKVLCSGLIILSHILIKKQCEITLFGEKLTLFSVFKIPCDRVRALWSVLPQKGSLFSELILDYWGIKIHILKSLFKISLYKSLEYLDKNYSK